MRPIDPIAARLRWLWETRLSATVYTGILLAALVALPATAGYLLAGAAGALFAVGATVAASYGAARHAHRYVLHALDAIPLRPWEAPVLFDLLRRLSARAGIPMPRLWLVPSQQPNAFAVGPGPSHAHIAVTSALVHSLHLRELAGVLAHEVAHIKNRDVLFSSFAATVTAVVASAGRTLAFAVLLLLPFFLTWAPQALLATLLLLLAPVPALLLQAALSRQREFAADAEAARLTGDPLALASALHRIENTPRTLFEWLFGWAPRRRREHSPLHSHPATEERIARLETM